MIQVIEKALQEKFKIGFNVIQKGMSTYIVRFKDSEKDSFFIEIIIKDDLRLSITIQPEEYGAGFLRNINLSNEEQRKVFAQYWNALGEKNIILKIDDVQISSLDFIQNKSIWKKFDLRYTKIPYYNDNDNKEKIVIDTLINLILMIFSILDYEIKLIDENRYEEGEKYLIQSIKYERNPINRQLCLLQKGYKCSVCGFDFEEKYGKIGKEYIEVHHLVMISTYGKSLYIDPNNDLVPLCSNCHAMIHRKFPPYTVEELKLIIKDNEYGKN